MLIRGFLFLLGLASAFMVFLS
uniref:Uncharacterized protein n=1 Tax=Rhizophora mucronata TaxID=61149 RepID=A0A2P2QKE7_RHIMU